MRAEFVRQMLVEMERDASILFISGDLGYRAFEPIVERFPDRFLNAGIAEANMVSMAAGLALTGWKPYVYSIASFASMRCYEQIRTDLCYEGLDVKIIAGGGGYHYGVDGVTHHTVEDLACMRVLPNMRVVCPAYGWEAKETAHALATSPGPAYVRVGKKPNRRFGEDLFTFGIGKAYEIRSGSDAAILATGNVLDLALDTAETLERNAGLSVCVASFPFVKPLDTAYLESVTKRMSNVFTLEEHSHMGGFGSAVGEWLLQEGPLHVRLQRFGLPDTFLEDVGTREYLLSRAGLDAEQLTRSIAERVRAEA